MGPARGDAHVDDRHRCRVQHAWSRQPAKWATVAPTGTSGLREATTSPTALPSSGPDLERRDVRRHVVHPPPHVGVDGHPRVADQHLTRPGLGYVHLHQGEVGGRGLTHGTSRQVDLAADGGGRLGRGRRGG